MVLHNNNNREVGIKVLTARTIMRYLRWNIRFVMRHPWLKSRLINIINNYPHLKSRLRNIALGYSASNQQSIPYAKTNKYENLSPTAKHIYKKLKTAIREQK